MILSELNKHAGKGSQERSVVLNIILFYILITYSIISFFIYPFSATAILLLFCLLITWRLSTAGYNPLFLFKLLLSQESLSHILSTDQIKQATKRRLKQMVSGGSHMKPSLLKNPITPHMKNSLLKNSGNRSTLRGPIEKATETSHKTESDTGESLPITPDSIQIREDVFSDEAFVQDIEELKRRVKKNLFTFELQSDVVLYGPPKLTGILDRIRRHDPDGRK